MVQTSCKKDPVLTISDFKSLKVTDLANGIWELEHHNFQGIRNTAPTDNLAKYITFNSDSTFIGYTGCNSIEGIYYANDSGNIFFFSLLNSTGAPCPSGTGEWHDIMTNQLLAAKTFSITNNTLIIVASSTDTIDQLHFTKMPQ